MTPFVTVLVPNYNHARYLPRRMDSILAQTYRDYEMVVLDDASTDNSREVLKRYAEQTPMRMVFNERNSGIPFIQWRRGAELAAGKYLWIAESDDYADPRLLEVLVSLVKRNPNVGLAYCQSHSVNEHDQILGTWEEWTRVVDPERWKRDFINNGADEAARYLVWRNTIPNASAVLVRKDLLLAGLEGAERMRLAGDWWAWARVLMQTDVAFVAEPLNYFRSHGRSVRDTTKEAANCAECFAVIAHICSRVPVSHETRRRTFRNIFYIWRRSVAAMPFPLDRRWLMQVHADGRRIYRGATHQMAWQLAKLLLKRIPFVLPVVRFVRSAARRAQPPEPPPPAGADIERYQKDE